MAGEKSKKSDFIEISSSEESESESESKFESESEPPSPESDEDFSERNSDDGEEEEEDGDSSCKWIDSEDEKEDECNRADDDDEDCVYKDDLESMCNKVVQIIRGRSDLQELMLVECKAYLRRHGLRLSGTKEECIERIKEHLRLKDGNGETYYPRSSFTIDCTGDVCKGDVVLFNQKVHQNRSKKMPGSRNLWRRTVAGRIVKESYGAAKQQHTFTVEVLWSKGAKRLDPMSPLLVKGRNLYKMKTFRQRWKNEKERLRVLAEKHKRGAAARTVRAMRNAKAVVKTKNSSSHKGPKRHKHSHHIGPSHSHRIGPGKRDNTTRNKKHPNTCLEPSAKNKKWQPRPNYNPFQTTSRSKQNSHTRHPNPVFQPNGVREFQGFSYNFPAQIPYHFQSNVLPREQAHHYFPSPRGFVPPAELPCLENPFPYWKGLGRGSYPHSRSSNVLRNVNYFPGLIDKHNPSSYPSSVDTHRWR
ncbi:SAP domain-containing protein [Striga hermonthica]|uniref:SAP domain-containing protein n=1 Tax=Striga hermonthica TaxID=68872 RepID=A0A9N7NY32_STRHE|nr:SAP domain-containing protein [Striga hermonthica]